MIYEIVYPHREGDLGISCLRWDIIYKENSPLLSNNILDKRPGEIYISTDKVSFRMPNVFNLILVQ